MVNELVNFNSVSVMNYAEGGCLWNVLQERVMPLDQKLNIVRGIIFGMGHLRR